MLKELSREAKKHILLGELPAAPNPKIDNWLATFEQPEVPPNEAQIKCPKLLNHFAVGSDPEFVLFDPKNLRVLPAFILPLKTGLAFGADLNGRLMEIRPKPSKFILNSVASILTTMRWLAWQLAPTFNDCQWICPPIVDRRYGPLKIDITGHLVTFREETPATYDGIGGHIHFGRKRQALRDIEVRALDVLFDLFCAEGVFDKHSNDLRLGYTTYGLHGDIRKQIHGYEYRSLPSWLGDPWLAYFCLTLGKLVVFDPQFALRFLHKGQLGSTLSKFIHFYKAWDVDAQIVAQGLRTHGIPKSFLTNIRTTWGLLDLPYPLDPDIFIPETLGGTEADKQAILDYIFKGQHIPRVEPVFTWEPKRVPANVEYVCKEDTQGQINLGEITAGLVCLKALPIRVRILGRGAGRYPNCIEINSLFRRLISVEKLMEMAPKLRVLFRDQIAGPLEIKLGYELRDSLGLHRVRQMLTSIFPIWHVRDIKPETETEYFRTTTTKVVYKG